MKPSPHDATPILMLRASEAARALAISERTLTELVKRGEIPVSRIGERNLRFSLAALESWVAGRTTWPTAVAQPAPTVGQDAEG